ncbi:lysozyme [Rhodovulum visakhapatnamense]|uniref:Lysozyme n=1 Tax=Rhodovulum visakhapatnamense TaxID=364297 RepID=A0A4R8F2Q2_9RHOB|nr:lysozyme [Rhodovulum visakhapatnamense]TDX19319.1 lysozyme [Rhodovulum visakhapatnamense]
MNKILLAVAGLVLIAVFAFPQPQPDIGIPTSAPESAQTQEARALALAVPLIAKWEGKRNAAYRDIVGVWTICYGHTRTARPGMVLSDADCEALLRAEVRDYRARLLTFFSAETRARRLPPPRDAAFTSLAINVGVAGVGRSTATRRLNAGDVPGACEALTWWNKAGGRVVAGLRNRRTEEYGYCMREAS